MGLLSLLGPVYYTFRTGKRYAVEFLGTLFLVFVFLATGHWAAIGLALAIAIFLGGKISGGHYNPAVTLAFTIKKTLDLGEMFLYMASQLLGGVVAYYLYMSTKRFIK